jgi:hypothetical protein
MMRSVVILLCLLLSNVEVTWAKHVKLAPGEVVLTLNAPGVDLKSKVIQPDRSLPRNWRRAQDPFLETRKTPNNLPSRQGLDDLQISGSGEFSKGQFLELLKKISVKNLVVLDLRQESHGFINHFAVSWYANDDALNANKNLEEIEKDESKRLLSILKEKKTVLTKLLQKRLNKMAVI